MDKAIDIKSTSLYKKSMECKAKANRIITQVVTDIEMCTSIDDMNAVAEKYNAFALSPNWVSFRCGGYVVEVQVTLMCAMCSTGGGINARARRLISLCKWEIMIELAWRLTAESRNKE